MEKLFDIETSRDVFRILDHKFNDYCRNVAKSADDILLLVMLTNHLREWVAPGYKPTWNSLTQRRELPRPISEEQSFSKEVFEHPNFSIIRKICNGTKHARVEGVATDVEYEDDMHNWTNMHKITDMSKGEIVSYLVDGRPVEDILEPLIIKYRSWFSIRNGR